MKPSSSCCTSAPSRIVCGVDFSDASRRAVEYAPQFDLDHYRRTLLTDARAKLEELVREDARNWCDPDTRLLSGKPDQEILRIAGEERSDLIVLGVHGRGPVDRMLFGSTTQAIVRQAVCPVLTIRP